MKAANQKKDIQTVLPFLERGIDKEGILEILENSGLGLPKYYDWRSRSGCTFCFFQRKIEWVGLLERHPRMRLKEQICDELALTRGLLLLGAKGKVLMVYHNLIGCSDRKPQKNIEKMAQRKK